MWLEFISFQEETMKRREWSIVLVCGLVAAFGLNLLGQEGTKAKKAPDSFKAKFETSAGDFVIEVNREWSPNGADRFYQLVSSGLYDECKFFRVVPKFMVQFGINGDPKVAAKWREATIKDDPVVKSNKRGFVTFAKSGVPNSRTSQIFISYGDNSFLDNQGFSPFGKVVEGMDVVDKINSQYAEKPDQGQVQSKGNEYLNDKFPKLDGVKKATIVE
jgi:peptidyl-prolyl cis-trans isomerase A (cyclophilin A)